VVARSDAPLGSTRELKVIVVVYESCAAPAVIAVVKISCNKVYVEPVCRNNLTTLAVDVPAAVIVTSSIRLPIAPAANTVPTFVGAVREVSAVAIDIALQRGVAAKFGAVAIMYFSYMLVVDII